MDLLERDVALRELDAALGDTARGEGRAALVSGEAGIDKTALVERFPRGQSGAVRVLWATCDALFTPRPFGPLHDIGAQPGGSLDRDDFRGAIDWGFLTLFGMLLGIGGVLQSVGVEVWIADSLVPLAQAAGSPGILVVLVGLFVVACRLALPWIRATLLLSPAIVPVGPQLGLSPWVVGFVVLTTANTWLHPNQAERCRLTRDPTEGEMFTDHQGLISGVAITLLTLLAIAASVPYWQALGVLSP
jgi:hypothetical protein